MIWCLANIICSQGSLYCSLALRIVLNYHGLSSLCIVLAVMLIFGCRAGSSSADDVVELSSRVYKGEHQAEPTSPFDTCQPR